MRLPAAALVTATAAARVVSAFIAPTTMSMPCAIRRSEDSGTTAWMTAAGGENDRDGLDGGGKAELDMNSLAERIRAVSASEAASSSAFEHGLRRRAREVAASELIEEDASTSGTVRLPALAFDALLPGQRLAGSSEDPTFSRLLRELGLGGLFVMISVDQNRRKLRRSGVVARIELVDVDRDGGPTDPTSVTFAVVGRRRCRVSGPAGEMVARVGRWRRGYDPDGEETRLGWGTERFVDMAPGTPGVSEEEEGEVVVGRDDGDAKVMEPTKWSLIFVDCALDESDDGDLERREVVATKAENLSALIDRWMELASDQRTYDNIDVVASTRRRKGEPGLRVEPDRLLKNVLSCLGKRPSPSKDPTAFAFWGAALINPLPPLGVAPEIRGMMLEAADAERRLEILEWGLKRSIGNLEGNTPL